MNSDYDSINGDVIVHENKKMGQFNKWFVFFAALMVLLNTISLVYVMYFTLSLKDGLKDTGEKFYDVLNISIDTLTLFNGILRNLTACSVKLEHMCKLDSF